MGTRSGLPLIQSLYQQYLLDQDLTTFVEQVSKRYTVGTLERSIALGPRMTRRGAVLALGFLGDYRVNRVLGAALVDKDRGVRTLAEDGLRMVWCRDGDHRHRRQLAYIIRANSSKKYDEAANRAGLLVEQAPGFAEAWNQRAIAYFKLGRYADSMRDCQRAIQINPFHFGAAAGLGQCYLALGRRSEALESLKRALRINPNLEAVRARIVALEKSK